MKNKNFVLYDLLYLINQSRKETNDTMIARALVESRYDLDNLTMDDLSRKYYISQASISRFIKKIGYDNYNQFKIAMELSKYAIETKNPRLPYNEPNQIKEGVYQDMLSLINCLQEIDMTHLMRVIKTIKQYNKIVFMGSDLSMAITHLLQVGLVAIGKNAYTIYNLGYQDEIINYISQDTLIICISIEARWFNRNESIEKILSSKAYKMLWTIEEGHRAKNFFDDVYLFGKGIKENLGYNELMYFVMLVYRLLMSQDD